MTELELRLGEGGIAMVALYIVYLPKYLICETENLALLPYIHPP